MSNRKGAVLFRGEHAGIVEETDDGYRFTYDSRYIQSENAQPVSLTLPLQAEPFTEKVLFSFFDGLIPEGWLLDVAQKNWKLDSRDRMGLLLSCCRETIGAVSVVRIENE